jgi:hypothetical protein
VDRICIPDPAVGSAYSASFASTARFYRILFSLGAVNRAGATSVGIVDNSEGLTYGARLNVDQLASASHAFVRLCKRSVRESEEHDQHKRRHNTRRAHLKCWPSYLCRKQSFTSRAYARERYAHFHECFVMYLTRARGEPKGEGLDV